MASIDIAAVYERHVDTVYRVCYAYFGNAADTEDAVQESFLKLMRSAPDFHDEEHEKRWLIRVATNHCKDVLRQAHRKSVPLEKTTEPADSGQVFDATLDAVLRLDTKYKDAVFLHYYEGYSTDEIATILERPASTVRSHLSEARAILKKELGGDRV